MAQPKVPIASLTQLFLARAMLREFEQHLERYQHLQQIRIDWCTTNPYLPNCDVADEYLLDAAELQNIPDFYIRLGKSINGEKGYYGGSLDAVDDCLCGGFGVVPPFKLRIKNSAELNYGFRPEAVNFWITTYRMEIDDFDTKSSTVSSIAASWNYLEDLLKIFQSRDVIVILD